MPSFFCDMKLFHCDKCGFAIYFENRLCENCRSRLGFEPEKLDLVAVLEGDTPGVWQAADEEGAGYRFCANAEWDVCNWLVRAESEEKFCAACRHNRTIPDLKSPQHVTAWRLFELAKHRLFYTVLQLKLPVMSRAEDPKGGLAFDFLEEEPGKRVITGHEDGLITLNLREADDAERARLRVQLGEPYRTLLGHFRHESGHYFWDRLVRDGDIEAFREVFGDERASYDQALREYYAKGPAADWGKRFVTAYASAHPWEDFAETWAHYLHIIDTMEMAREFGLRSAEAQDENSICFACEDTENFTEFIAQWRALTIVMNSLNRCMGQADLYPFVLSVAVLGKLEFVHGLVSGVADAPAERVAVVQD